MKQVICVAWILLILGCCSTFSENVLKNPDGCSIGSCRFHLQWKVISPNVIHFELNAKEPGNTQTPWIAVGFNEKAEMDQTGVIECAWNGTRLTMKASYNVGHTNNILEDPEQGIVKGSIKGTRKDKHLMCSFEHLIRLNPDEGMTSKVKPLDKPYYIIFASGQTDNKGMKTKHFDRPFISPTLINLVEGSALEGLRSPFIMAHGSVMVIVWLILINFASLTSRYFKDDWLQGMVLYWKPLWFQIHRFLAFISASLIIISILIISSSREWKFYVSTHSILGLTVTSLVAFNLLSGILRPLPGSPARKYYRYFHGFSGHALHLIGFVTLYFGLSNPQAYLPEWVAWLPIAFLVLRLIVDILLTILYQRNPNRNCYEELVDNSYFKEPWSWKYTIAISYFIISFGASLAIIVALAFSPVHIR